MGPCEVARFDIQMVQAFFVGVNLLFVTWLVHRRHRADRERRRFESAMCLKHGIDPKLCGHSHQSTTEAGES